MRTDVRNPQSVKNTARSAATGKWMTMLARFGYAIKGVVYLIIGGLALASAFGQGGQTTDQRGALQAIYDQPLGKFLLAFVAIGLLAYALWSFIQAIFDTEAKGKDGKGILARVGYAAVGVSYLLLAFGTFQLWSGKSGGKSSTATTQFWTAEFLRQPFGVPLVILGGLVVLAVAISLFVKAWQAHFQRRLTLSGVAARTRKLIVFLGRFGYAALGVVFTIIGIFLIAAALQHNANQARGLDTALATLAQQPFGPLLLGIVALGLFAYGIYSLVEARYRRVGRVL